MFVAELFELKFTYLGRSYLSAAFGASEGDIVPPPASGADLADMLVVHSKLCQKYYRTGKANRNIITGIINSAAGSLSSGKVPPRSPTTAL